jgi:hypothetical protein
MTLQELIRQGHGRNQGLKTKDCLFYRGDARLLAAWAKAQKVIWADGTSVTAASVEDLFGRAKDTCCAIGVSEDDGDGDFQLVAPLVGNRRYVLSKWGDWADNVDDPSFILLDRHAVQERKSDLPVMEF